MDFEILFDCALIAEGLVLTLEKGCRLTLDEAALELRLPWGAAMLDSGIVGAIREQLLDCAAWVA